MKWLAVLGAVSAIGCGDDVQSVCGPAQILDTRTVEAGEFLEGEFDLIVGSEIEFTFRSTAALSYDIHVHDGENFENLVEGVSMGESFVFTADRPGFHYPMFGNSTDEDAVLDVEFSIDSRGCWNSWL